MQLLSLLAVGLSIASIPAQAKPLTDELAVEGDIIDKRGLTCGLRGNANKKYVLARRQYSLGKCATDCSKSKKCKSYGYGNGSCTFYSASSSKFVKRSKSSSFRFYDKACPNPGKKSTTTRRRTSTTSQRLSATRTTSAAAATSSTVSDPAPGSCERLDANADEVTTRNNKRFNLLCGTLVTGDNIDNNPLSTESYQDCVESCSSYTAGEECVALTYQVSAGTCYRYSSITGAESNSDFSSGTLIVPGPANSTCEGLDAFSDEFVFPGNGKRFDLECSTFTTGQLVDGETRYTEAFQDCAGACAVNDRCVAFTYDRSSIICYRYATVGERRSDPNAGSGFLIGGGSPTTTAAATITPQ